MKRLCTLYVVFFILTTANAQENDFTLSGGYAFSKLTEYDENTTGWRINGLYEFTPMSGNFSQGLSFGYIHTNATVSEIGGSTTEFNAGHWPIYYAPKYTFGEKALRPFVKGALGWHFSSYDRKGALGLQIETGDSGFYGGLGAGLSWSIAESWLINLEYEWAYLGNSWYSNAFINSLTLGIGIKF